MPLPIGTVLDGKFKIVQVLGEGGMGTVYKVVQEGLQSGMSTAVNKVVGIGTPGIPLYECAVKELLITSEEERNVAVERFKKEIDILRGLNHPYIARFYDSFQERGNYYFVMEFVPGSSLEKKLEENKGPLPEDQVIQWAMQVCEALSYIHTQTPPIVLRDLKPGNIMITLNGAVKMIDFGIARRVDPNKKTNTENLGTISYASPEHLGSITARGYQRSSKSPKVLIQTGPRSDIYSLGATIYHLLTNYEPDPIMTPPQGSILAKNPRLRVVQRGNVIECPIEQVIIKAMQYYPENRFKDAEEMRRALWACLSSNGATTIQTSAGSPNATIIVRPVGVICPRCGYQNRPGAKFCKQDGLPLSAGATRVPPQAPAAPRAPIRARPVPINNANGTMQTPTTLPNAITAVSSSGVTELICPRCGSRNRPEAKFCKYDGQPLLQGATTVPPQPRMQTISRPSIQAKPVPQPALARSVPPPPPPPIRARPIASAAASAPAVVDHNRLGREAMKNQNYAEAVEQFKQASATGASYDVLFDLGRAYRQYGLSFKDANAKLFTENLKFAAERLEEAIGYKADSLEAYFQLGMCYRDLKLYPQAMAAFQNAHRVAPQDLGIYYQMGMLAMEQGYMQEAQAHLLEGLKINPDYLPLLIALGHLYIEMRKYKMAVSTLLSVTQRDPAHWEAWFELGRAHMKLKAWKPALNALEQALQQNPDAPVAIQLAMATCYLNVNKKVEARQKVQEVLQRDPNNAEAIRLQKQL
jgi:serine/threonine protein kinase/tetratricopeptide (TPR) repeat protein